jgi:hypothetical protein
MGALLTTISPLMAQSGRVRIRVIDPTGAVLRNAEASVLGKDEKSILAGRTNKDGEIVLAGLPIGNSRITVTCQGFKNLRLIVTIQNADEIEVEAKLKFGPITMY